MTPQWKNRQLLPGQSPYVLDVNRSSIDQFNLSLHKGDTKIIVESLPEPFIGNPQSARVVLLNLNPGHSEDYAKAHSDKDFRGAMMRDLRHEPPFSRRSHPKLAQMMVEMFVH
jgi:hypothetical protein